MASKKIKVERCIDISSKSWNAVATKLASYWTRVVNAAPDKYIECDAFIWYFQLEIGTLTLFGANQPKWEPISYQYIATVDLIVKSYEEIEEFNGLQYELGYNTILKQTIGCLKETHKKLISRKWPKDFEWLKIKPTFLVDNEETFTSDELLWIGGNKSCQLSLPPLAQIKKFCQKHGVVPQWMFIGSRKRLTAILIYEAANRNPVLRELERLLKGLPKAFLPRKLLVDRDVKMRQSYLRQIESLLGCESKILSKDFFDYIETIDQSMWDEHT